MKRSCLATLVAAALAAPAFATPPVVVLHQNQLLAAADAPHSAQADAWKRWAEEFSRDMRANMGTMYAPRMGGKLVKGAPYTAEVITETNQGLADGNVISRRKTGLIFRDGEGRTRQETMADGSNSTIHISDPVEGRHVILSPGSKTAVSLPRAKVMTSDAHGKHKQVVRVNETEIRLEDGKVFANGKEVPGGKYETTNRAGKKIVVENGRVTVDGKDLATAEGRGESVVRSVERTTGEDGTTREEVRVKVVRGDRIAPLPPTPPIPPQPPVPGAPGAPALAPLPPMPPLPGVGTFRFESTAKLGKGVTTSLGTRDFDGVKAEGKSTVWTIPAGEIGNRNPINVTSESWYSPELQVTVMSRYNDPRTGESIYRLANIRRVEPAAELFKVPADYTTRSRSRG